MRLRLLFVAMCTALGPAALTLAAEPVAPNVKAVIEDSARKYEQAFAARDAKALTSLFTSEAEYIDGSGAISHGQAAIEQEFTRSLAESPQGTLKVQILAIRPIATGVIVEDGVSTFLTQAGFPASQVPYTATHVRQADGTWKMASVRELSEAELSPHARLQSLSWLAGAWTENVPGGAVATTWKWSEDGNYLVSEFSFVGAKGRTLAGSQRLGWDAQSGKYRSWIFNVDGSSAEGLWKQEKDGTWTAQVYGATAEGIPVMGTLTYAPDGGDGLVITQTELGPDGSAIQSHSRRLVRQPPAPDRATGTR